MHAGIWGPLRESLHTWLSSVWMRVLRAIGTRGDFPALVLELVHLSVGRGAVAVGPAPPLTASERLEQELHSVAEASKRRSVSTAALHAALHDALRDYRSRCPEGLEGLCVRLVSSDLHVLGCRIVL